MRYVEGGFTLREMANLVAEVHGELNPRSPDEMVNISGIVYHALAEAREKARQEAGDYWEIHNHDGFRRASVVGSELVYDLPHVGAILDEFSGYVDMANSDTPPRHLKVLREKRITPALLRRVEDKILFVSRRIQLIK